ncbi:MAG: type IVB secretion system protein IcmH/DotU [Rhodospirillaceae bacterium]
MMSDREMFGDDDSTTFAMPTPGGRGRTRPSSQPAPTSASKPAAGPVDLPLWSVSAKSPLLAPAAPLLALATRIQTMVEQPDVGALRDRIIEAMRGFEKQGKAAGVEDKVLGVGHYALCTFIDEMVQRTPWGQSSGWAKQSIASTFHGNVVGGDQFFDWLKQLQQNPGRFGPVLELMYYCLSLGFEGRYRVLDRGRSDHARIRDGVYATIREVRGDYERELSPHWRGIKAVHRTLASVIPLWVPGVVAAAFLTTLYLGFNFALHSDAKIAAHALIDLPPKGLVSLALAAPPAPKPSDPEPPPAPVANTVTVVLGPSPIATEMHRVLKREIDEGLVDVSETRQVMTVRLVGDGMFDSGSDAVKDPYGSTLERIAKALRNEPGEIRITGHTDNVPIRRNIRFPSNFDLSVARAEAVRKIIGRHVSATDRMRTEGKGDQIPIGTNDTPEGRSKNRRIELLLVKTERSGS